MGSLEARFGGRIPNSVIAVPVLFVLCAVMAVLVVMTAGADIKAVQNQKLDDVTRWRTAVVRALDATNRDVRAKPCTAEFQEQIRAIAFWPDGLNEFLYVPNRTVVCSGVIRAFDPPVELGQPDVALAEFGMELWIERDLSMLGLPGSRGTLAKIGAFAAIVPSIGAAPSLPPWLESQFVAVHKDGTHLAIAGNANLFTDLSGSAASSRSDLASGIACSKEGVFCVATAIDGASWVSHHGPHLVIGVVLLSLFAYLITLLIADDIRKHFSFDARVVRNLTRESIVVAYQPIYDLKEKTISGVEVLARYREADGTIVYPDRFIDLVLSSKRTLELTRLVIEAAKSDLNRHWSFDRDLQVNVNIFPRDLGSDELHEICGSFSERANPRLKLAVEIVEYEEIDRDELSAVVEKLHDRGIKIYIDDFGIGYSSVESVGTLPIDGIKLERSFAMAPIDSVMGRMFLKVIELLKTTGKPLVIEGIEDVSKIGKLAEGNWARYAQGYGIGKPMPIEDFVKLIGNPPKFAHEAAA